MSQEPAKTSRISTKLALALTLLALIYSALLSGIYIALQLPQVEKEFNEQINGILDTFQQPATQAVFHLDEESANTSLRGLAHYAFIQRALIESDTGELLAERSFLHQSGSERSYLFWLFSVPDITRYERKLSDERFEEGVHGRLIVDVNLLSAYNDVLDKLYAVITANMLQALVFVVIVYFIVHRMIARRLIAVSDALATISPESPNQSRVPTFAHSDEISHLALSINQFIHAAEQHIDAKDEAEKGLLYLTQHLEEVIKERTTDLENTAEKAELARDEANQANRAKSIFLSNMSHELRTPLNSIIGFTRRLLHHKTLQLGGRERDALERVYDNGQYLLHLVNDLLDIAKIEADKMELSYATVSINDLLDDTFKKLTNLADSKGLDLINNMTETLEVDADQSKLQQVFINVISNAIKYTPTGSIMVSAEGVVDDCLIIAIIDTGIGIKKSDFSKLFDPYNHIHSDLSDTVSVQSTGLGLPLAHKIMKIHGGDILVESKLGKGSTFRLVLPIKKPESLELTSTDSAVEVMDKSSESRGQAC
ncbi:MAG: ATP-binding protein [Pseudomonadales bacterium]|nr:ATP-binding protein [Pseudomonadales bacterium]